VLPATPAGATCVELRVSSRDRHSPEAHLRDGHTPGELDRARRVGGAAEHLVLSAGPRYEAHAAAVAVISGRECQFVVGSYVVCGMLSEVRSPPARSSSAVTPTVETSQAHATHTVRRMLAAALNHNYAPVNHPRRGALPNGVAAGPDAAAANALPFLRPHAGAAARNAPEPTGVAIAFCAVTRRPVVACRVAWASLHLVQPTTPTCPRQRGACHDA